jgi:hypothetical protein
VSGINNQFNEMVESHETEFTVFSIPHCIAWKKTSTTNSTIQLNNEKRSETNFSIKNNDNNDNRIESIKSEMNSVTTPPPPPPPPPTTTTTTTPTTTANIGNDSAAEPTPKKLHHLQLQQHEEIQSNSPKSITEPLQPLTETTELAKNFELQQETETKN